MYTTIDFPTKRALKAALAAGEIITVYQPGPFGPEVRDGRGCIEGPHYPKTHTWYASVEVKDGKIVRLT